MDIQKVVAELKTKFGDSVNVEKVKEMFKDQDLSKFSMTEIIAKVKDHGLLGDLDGDGVKESFFEEIKGKVGHMFGK